VGTGSVRFSGSIVWRGVVCGCICVGLRGVWCVVLQRVILGFARLRKALVVQVTIQLAHCSRL